eukprot:4463447-Pyramimonas_sp.AAC.1
MAEYERVLQDENERAQHQVQEWLRNEQITWQVMVQQSQQYANNEEHAAKRNYDEYAEHTRYYHQ